MRYEVYQKGSTYNEEFVVFNLDSQRKEIEGDHAQILAFAQKHQADHFFVNSPLVRSFFLSKSILSNSKEPAPLKFNKSQSFLVRFWHSIGFNE